MSSRTKFILTVVTLLTVFLVIEYRMPRKFVWEPTFAHQDPQPFGCLVFDSVLAASMPQGYTVTSNTLWQMEKDSVFAGGPKAVLIITKEDIDAQIKKVFDLASQGHTVLVATTDLYNWCDTLGIDYEYNKTFKLADIAGKWPEKGLLFWESDTFCSVPVYNQMIERSLVIPDTVTFEVLATFLNSSEETVLTEDTVAAEFSVDSLAPEYPEETVDSMVIVDEDSVVSEAPEVSNTYAVAAAFPIGEGKLILVSSPLLLTNYGMVSGDGHRFIAHLMNCVKHLPVIRSEGYMAATANREQSPLYVLLQKPPMRWAVYLTMLTMLLFCIFTARRRQRVIPIITKPHNANLEFVHLIGTLYWQRHDNADLLAKKLAYTTEELRRQLNIDLTTTVPGGAPAEAADALRLLAAHTGRDTEELRLLLHNIRQAASGNYVISDPELKTFIDQLDSLLMNNSYTT